MAISWLSKVVDVILVRTNRYTSREGQKGHNATLLRFISTPPTELAKEAQAFYNERSRKERGTMADQNQLALLQYQPGAWSTWRKQYPEISPDLREANLRRADLSETNLSRADFDGADLSETNLTYSNLSGAALRRANLSNAVLQNTRLNETILDGILLRGANLWGADFSGQHRVNLNGADLTKTTLMEANLSRADLGGTNLSEASLAYSNLSGAYLSGANLKGADLSGADLSGANLKGADLSGATVGWTKFTNVDLRGVKGLKTIIHEGPSSIGIDTLSRSQGQIPESFLRKAGIPEDFLTYLPSLMNHAIEYYTCFISYSSQDEDFVQRLYADLQANGVRCWFAPQDLKIGDKTRQRIDESIRLYDKLLLVLSEQSVISTWVEYEVEAALAKERRESCTALFPISLDRAVKNCATAWATHIKDTRHIGNFTQWKDHDTYQQGLMRLLRDLQPERL
jgi:uncharacterized protein YjbI with pentapeptide repeats